MRGQTSANILVYLEEINTKVLPEEVLWKDIRSTETSKTVDLEDIPQLVMLGRT